MSAERRSLTRRPRHALSQRRTPTSYPSRWLQHTDTWVLDLPWMPMGRQRSPAALQWPDNPIRNSSVLFSTTNTFRSKDVCSYMTVWLSHGWCMLALYGLTFPAVNSSRLKRWSLSTTGRWPTRDFGMKLTWLMLSCGTTWRFRPSVSHGRAIGSYIFNI